ncbi:MAG TPA: DUF5615 family PIN-like protein [Anaerolineae bacterium]|nr:DUF5615 family PIN-like protein [Anaerolineae bacterium]
MSQLKLLLDEDVWGKLAPTLRDESFDVVHVGELGREGLPDSEQLAYAARSGRAILTHNTKDFVPLATLYFFEERPHAGIIVSPQISKGSLLKQTLHLLQTLSAEAAANTLRFLTDVE